jgi:hypothetical protein
VVFTYGFTVRVGGSSVRTEGASGLLLCSESRLGAHGLHADGGIGSRKEGDSSRFLGVLSLVSRNPA